MSLKDSCKALVAVSLLTVAAALPAYAQGDSAAAPATGTTALPAADAPADAPVSPDPMADSPAPEAAPKTVEVSNPYGMSALWAQGDFVARGVLIIMLIMSASTWYIMIMKLIEQQKVYSQAREANARFWSSKSVSDGIGALKTGTPFWYIADRGIKASQHHEGTMVEQIDLNSWVTMSVNRAVEEIQSRLQGGLAVLATVGSTAPFVGLFGTVWGIYHALIGIASQGNANLETVAGPMGEALIATAAGLATALPAVLGYNALIRGNRLLRNDLDGFAHDLHAHLLSLPTEDAAQDAPPIRRQQLRGS
jgi:biopolymer transport protein ExbB